MKKNSNSTERQYRLLILDDDAMAGDTIRKIGEYLGFQCKQTTSVTEFFTGVRDWSPDVIALDLFMPGKDGLEVMSQLADQKYSADLIITSGMGERILDAALLSASEYGLNSLGVLAKPFSIADMRTLLGQVGKLTNNHNLLDPSDVFLIEPTSTDLKRAIDLSQITVAYQPKIFCRTGTLAGFEVLARWYWNDYWVSPDTFIVMAEDFGLIDDLTRLVVEQSLVWFANIPQHAYYSDLRSMQYTTLSLNISAKSLTNQNLLNWIVKRCDELQIERKKIIFELTETSATNEFVSALSTLTRLCIKGFHLSIDDFGTGYSSMVQLVRLPFSEIKIDKSFVIANRNSAVSNAVVRSIIDLGHSLNMLSTAEGVEDEKTLDFLRELGCDMAQGYHIAKPMPGEDIFSWMKQRESNRELSRLKSVKKTMFFDSAPDRDIDRLTQLTARLLSVPIALITVLDQNTEWFKSKIGLSVTKLSRNQSFCTYTIEHDDILIVEDTTQDERFQSLDIVLGNEHIRFYAGHPLCLPNGNKIGTLCVLDRYPRSLSETEARALKHLSAMVEFELAETLKSEHSQFSALVDKKKFLLKAKHTLKLAAEMSQRATLFYVVLNELSLVNRRHDRATGDHCLQGLVDVVMQSVESSDLVGRYRGAEIVILRVDESESTSQSLQNAVAQRLEQLNNKLTVPISALFSSAPLKLCSQAALSEALEEARASAKVITYY
jgi:diguanylate cyclase (GGDEF)-like protein